MRSLPEPKRPDALARIWRPRRLRPKDPDQLCRPHRHKMVLEDDDGVTLVMACRRCPYKFIARLDAVLG